jgi:B12-binding domain/radical SAM domain protein
MLRVIAVAAPHWPGQDQKDAEMHLASNTPFSLLNALRVAIGRTDNPESAWYSSNWRDVQDRTNSVFMSDYLEPSKKWLHNAIEQVNPNLLLIGAMTLSMPGAVELAGIVKRKLGNQCLVVLGGKHINETVYLENNSLNQHMGSPLKLMAKGKIPQVFDLLVSGDGEEIVAQIGEVVSKLLSSLACPAENVTAPDCRKVLLEAKGDWILCWNNKVEQEYIASKNKDIDYGTVPYAGAMLPIKTNFPVLGREITAHAYSDTSKGCIYSCSFCSESMRINGGLRGLSTAGGRLGRQLKKIAEHGRAVGLQASAFVEDSILLQGKISSLKDLYDYLLREHVDVTFGAQFTVDGLLNAARQDVVRKLAMTGFNYVFMGLETADEDVASTMSKNNIKEDKGGEKCTWVEKTERAIQFLYEVGIKSGVSVLFGLGEDQSKRKILLKHIKNWQEKYDQPNVVSLNWAVRHPLREPADRGGYEYVEWGTDPDSPILRRLSKLFGEASTRYCLDGVKMATVGELDEIAVLYDSLKNEI